MSSTVKQDQTAATDHKLQKLMSKLARLETKAQATVSYSLDDYMTIFQKRKEKSMIFRLCNNKTTIKFQLAAPGVSIIVIKHFVTRDSIIARFQKAV